MLKAYIYIYVSLSECSRSTKSGEDNKKLQEKTLVISLLGQNAPAVAIGVNFRVLLISYTERKRDFMYLFFITIYFQVWTHSTSHHLRDRPVESWAFGIICVCVCLFVCVCVCLCVCVCAGVYVCVNMQTGLHACSVMS